MVAGSFGKSTCTGLMAHILRESGVDLFLFTLGAATEPSVVTPATVADRATFADSHQLSVGVRDVLVNGVRVLIDGEHTGATPGRRVGGPAWQERAQ